MTRVDTRPRHVAFCPHCGNRAPQCWIGNHKLNKDQGSVDIYTLVFCETCDQALLYRANNLIVHLGGASGPFCDLRASHLVWPRAGTLHESVPDGVRQCYEEAASIKGRA